MRAVNLIREQAAGRGVRSGGGGGFLVLAVLAALVAGVAYYVLTNNAVLERRAELAALQTQAQAAQTQADATRPYREFAVLAQSRVQTVRQLGAARFDWHRALRQLSKVMPGNVWLTSLLGTVAPGVNVEGASSGATGPLRASMPNPAIELTGCTTSHDSVARLISRLRLVHGVQRVSLADSIKNQAGNGSGGANGGASAGGDCRHNDPKFPQFDLVIFFAPLPAVPAPAQGGAGAGSPPAAAGTAQPAAATTPAPSAPPASGSATP
jgi:Tfp pilus assembly protein PilN